MKKFSFVVVLITVCIHAMAKEPPLLFAAPVQGNIQVLKAGRYSYCITGGAVYQIEKKGLVQKALLQSNCNDAAVYNNNIILATNNGMQLFDTKTNTLTAYLPEAIEGNISHVQTDGQNHVWFTRQYAGCFVVNDSNKVEQRIKVPATYALAYTCNGYMWVGTNVGLYKVPVQQGAIERYAEEGISGSELPDNLVERLFTDARSNVWVMMPEHISFIAADSKDEFPDFEQVGNKHNAVHDITAAGAKAWLFATAQGILLVHDLQHGEVLYSGEIHQHINEQAYLLTDAVTGRPGSLQNETVINIKTCGTKTYFITNIGMWSVNTAKFMNRLKSRFEI